MLRRHAFRMLAAVLVLGAVVHVATAWPRVWDLAGVAGPGSRLVVAGYAVAALTALAACGLAALLLWKAVHRRDARALTLFLAFLAFFWGSLFRFMEVGGGERSVEVNLSYGSGWVSQTALAAFLLAFAAFLRFSALFPRPLTARRLGAAPSPGALPGRAFHRIRVAFLDPVVVWGSAVGVYLVQRYLPRLVMAATDMSAVEGGAPTPRAVTLAFLGTIVLMGSYALGTMALGARNLSISYRRAEGDERRRVQWVVFGFTTAWWLILGGAGLVAVSVATSWQTNLLGAALPLAAFVAPLVVVAGAAVGILYSGAIDPALALQRSTLYGILGVLGIVGFTALESVLSELVEARVPLPGLVGPVASGVLVAVVLLPLRSVLARRLPGGSSALVEGEGPEES